MVQSKPFRNLGNFIHLISFNGRRRCNSWNGRYFHKQHFHPIRKCSCVDTRGISRLSTQSCADIFNALLIPHVVGFQMCRKKLSNHCGKTATMNEAISTKPQSAVKKSLAAVIGSRDMKKLCVVTSICWMGALSQTIRKM